MKKLLIKLYVNQLLRNDPINKCVYTPPNIEGEKGTCSIKKKYAQSLKKNY